MQLACHCVEGFSLQNALICDMNHRLGKVCAGCSGSSADESLTPNFSILTASGTKEEHSWRWPLSLKTIQLAVTPLFAFVYFANRFKAESAEFASA